MEASPTFPQSPESPQHYLRSTLEPVKDLQAEPLAKLVALVRPEEQGHASQSKVSLSIPLAVQGVDLGIRVQIAHTLFTHNLRVVQSESSYIALSHMCP